MSGAINRERLAALRAVMTAEKIDYYLIPTADYHNSEYVAPLFQTRHYFSGFSGSSGTLVVGREEAGLWTDGRYFIQAEKELTGTGVDLYRDMEEGVPTVSEWLADRLSAGGTLAFDGRCLNVVTVRNLQKKLAGKKISFRIDRDPAEGIWQDRPALPSHPAFVLDEKYSGESAQDKLGRLRAAMEKAGAGVYVDSMLDNLMWLFNLRGRDVECTPVALSFGVVTMDRQILFLQENEVTAEVRTYADSIGLELKPYDAVYAFLEDPALYLAAGGAQDHEKTKVMCDPSSLSICLWNSIRKGRFGGEDRDGSGSGSMEVRPEPVEGIVERRSPVEAFKAVKNETELANIRACYRDDSAAVCRFLYWIDQHVKNGTVGSLTELTAADHMDGLRAQIDDFVELSFGTISAYGPNAAMMHYSAKPDDCAQLRPEGMLLVDCGGQYLRGTTDVTRTTALGPVTDEMRRHYTLTAVGNLQLLDAVFLYGCTGRNVDILARQPLWSTFVDYKCGTGHGIGYLLGVHEGPQNIRWRFANGMQEVVLEPGMIVSDEPGVYIEGQYGIRIETILEVVEAAKNGDGRFLRFAPLTLVPLDRNLIDPAYLTPQTREVLNRYHARVYEEVGPLLTQEERDWLREQTRPVEGTV